MTSIMEIKKRKDGSVTNILVNQLGMGITLFYNNPSRCVVS